MWFEVWILCERCWRECKMYHIWNMWKNINREWTLGVWFLSRKLWARFG
jgi:hypothetical protein